MRTDHNLTDLSTETLHRLRGQVLQALTERHLPREHKAKLYQILRRIDDILKSRAPEFDAPDFGM